MLAVKQEKNSKEKVNKNVKPFTSSTRDQNQRDSCLFNSLPVSLLPSSQAYAWVHVYTHCKTIKERLFTEQAF